MALLHRTLVHVQHHVVRTGNSSQQLGNIILSFRITQICGMAVISLGFIRILHHSETSIQVSPHVVIPTGYALPYKILYQIEGFDPGIWREYLPPGN
jgi:hypothetical protein